MIKNKENNKIIRNKAIKILIENKKRINKNSLDKIIDKINNGKINNSISLTYLLKDDNKNNITFKDIEDINKKINNNEIEYNKINELFDKKLKDDNNDFEYLKKTLKNMRKNIDYDRALNSLFYHKAL
jgi:hypothetical protein